MGVNKVRQSNGFTLIETLFVLLTVAVLAGIAYPTYVESVRKSKRAEGRAALYLLMQQQERYYSRHNSYIAFSAQSDNENEKMFKWYSGSSPSGSAYEMKAEACDSDTIRNCVRIIAMPGTLNVDAGYRDPTCGEMSMTSAGIKHANTSECWK